jgi:hypothetical protein
MDRAAVIDPQACERRVGWGSTVVLGAVTVVALGFVMTVASPYFTLDPQRFGPYWPQRDWLLWHIGGGMVALLVGPAQLWLGLTRRIVRLHRGLGVGYTAGVAVSSTAALNLACTTD